MYRIILFVFALTMVSCVKKGNYTCTCSKSNVLLESVTYNSTNLKNAQDNCNQLTDKYRTDDSVKAGLAVTCEVK